MIHLISSVDSSTTVVVTGYHLAKLVGNLSVPHSDLPLFVRIVLQITTNHTVSVLAARLDSGPMRKQRFVNLEERLLVVDE